MKEEKKKKKKEKKDTFNSSQLMFQTPIKID